MQKIKTRTRLASKPAKRATYPLDRARSREVVWDDVNDLMSAARPFWPCSFVYLIGESDKGAVKIGLAKDPIQRLRAMQTGNPRRLCVEGVLLGDAVLEHLLHLVWEPFAIQSATTKRGIADQAPGTEWFKAEVRELILAVFKRAAGLQAEYIGKGDNVSLVVLERIVRDTCRDAGIGPKARDYPRTPARGGGYVIPRPKSAWVLSRA